MWLRPRGRDALAHALAACRRDKDLTQEQLASRLRINRTTLIDMEAGRNQSMRRWSEAISLLGYDVIVVPRGASVQVNETSDVSDG